MFSAIPHMTTEGAMCKQKSVSSGVYDSGTSQNDLCSECVEMSLKCTNTGIFIWLPSWNDAPITTVTVNNSAWAIIYSHKSSETKAILHTHFLRKSIYLMNPYKR